VSNVYVGDDMNFKKLTKSRESKFGKNEVADFKISAASFVKKLRLMITRGKSIEKSKPKCGAAFKLRMYVLQQILVDIMSKMTSASRTAPMGIIIHGQPSIGKSSLITHIAKIFAKFRDLEYSADLIYHRNPKQDYWTNHDPQMQPIIHYPELGSVNSKIAGTQGDKTVDEMLMVADTQPFAANMAAVEEKGKVMLMPELLIVDCNDPKMNLEVTNNNPAAIRRRFIYVEVKVKKEYEKLGSLDESKIPSDLRDKMDLWTFRVYKQMPHDSITKSFEIDLGAGLNIFEFSDLIYSLMEEHDRKQAGYNDAVQEEIEKYLHKKVTSESNYFSSSKTWIPVIFLLFFFPWYWVITFIFSRAIYAFLYEWVASQQGLLSFAEIKVLNYFTTQMTPHLWKVFYDDAKTDFKVYGMYSYYKIRHLLGYDDEMYYQYKISFSCLSHVKCVSIAIITFTITLAILRVMLSFCSFIQSISSEGNIIESSGNFSNDKIDENIDELERELNCQFPKSKKKTFGDATYDVVENIHPRVMSAELNKKNPEELLRRIQHNERFLMIEYNGKPLMNRGLGIKGDYIIVNKHCIPGNSVSIVSSCRENYESNVKRIVVNRDDMLDVGEDLIMFRFYGELFKDITDMLIEEKDFKVSVEGRYADKKCRVEFFKESVTVKNHFQNYVLTKSFKYEDKEHKNGICGRPLLITFSNVTFVGGIHSAGSDNTSTCYATVVNKDKILNAITADSNSLLSNVYSEGSIRLPKGKNLNKITSKCPVLYEDTPGLGVVGSISNYAIVTPKTRLIESSIINEIESLVGVSPFGENGKLKSLPPMMKSKIVDGKYIAPHNIWIKKVGVIKNTLPTTVMKVTVAGICSHLLLSLKKRGVVSLTPLSLAVAQNGFPENFYMRAMKSSTSGGFLLPGNKSRYSSKVVLDFKEDGVMPNFDIKEQVLEIFDSYKRGELSHEIVGAQLKDEPRAFDKAEAGKTRVFAMSSYPGTLVNRMMLMPFYSLMVEHRDVFCTKVGINMHSSEAGEMYDDLVTFSPLIMEGDYGGYDTSMPVGVGLMANSVVENCLSKLGYNPSAMQMVKGILSDNLYPTLALEGNLLIAAGFQPSGKYATAEDNSLRGLILLYYAYVVMCTKIGEGHPLNTTTSFDVGKFFNYLKPVTYGDDMLCAVKDEIAPYFNNITYGTFVNAVYGMEFTSAEKHEHTSKFIEPSKMSFLKRSFVYNDMLGRKVALLDKESIVKSLTYILPSKEVSLDEQLVQTCQSALRELFFYFNNAEEYNSKRAQFIELLVKKTQFTLNDLELLFPKGEELKIQYEHHVN
jgi:hypothetical protein